MIRGTKVPVRRVWTWHRKGVSTETLVKRYPTIGWTKILDALSFAYDNSELMDADIKREEEFLEGIAEHPHPHRPIDGAELEVVREEIARGMAMSQRAHCGHDPSAVGACGGYDASCSCECNTCEPPPRDDS